LEEIHTLRQGAEKADAIIHTGFNHDFSRFAEHCETDRRAIETFGEVLLGSHRPLIVTSGVAGLAIGREAVEADMAPEPTLAYPRQSEATAMALARRGVHAMVVRLPPSVHGEGDKGFVPFLIRLARDKGVSAYINDGDNEWSATHREDAAQVYLLVLMQGKAGHAYHAVAESSITFKDIATRIGHGLEVPVVSLAQNAANTHFGWFSVFAAMNARTASQHTQESLAWRPNQPGLLSDMMSGHYFKL